MNGNLKVRCSGGSHQSHQSHQSQRARHPHRSRWSVGAALLLAGALSSLAGSPATAADYPTKPIQVLIPFATGGATQALSERVGVEMGKELGQPLVGDYRGGAGGTIAAEAAARATPDGYTLFMGATGALAVAPAVSKVARYNAATDFQGVALIATTPYVLVINSKFPVRTLKELIEYARANPGKLNFASSGTGGADHIAGEILQKMANFSMTHVPYKGAGPYLQDLLAGRIDVAIISPIPIRAMIEAGRVRALGVTTPHRSQAPFLKDIPTIAEEGVTGYNITAWYGYLVPARTPADVVNRLAGAAAKAINLPANRDWLLSQGLSPGTLSPAEFTGFVAAESKKWGDFAKQLNIQVE